MPGPFAFLLPLLAAGGKAAAGAGGAKAAGGLMSKIGAGASKALPFMTALNSMMGQQQQAPMMLPGGMPTPIAGLGGGGFNRPMAPGYQNEPDWMRRRMM